MLQVNVFTQYGHVDSGIEVYARVEQAANEFLQECHITREQIVATHANMSASNEWTEYALTLIVDLPEPTKEEN